MASVVEEIDTTEKRMALLLGTLEKDPRCHPATLFLAQTILLDITKIKKKVAAKTK